MHTPPRRRSPHAAKRSPTFTGPDSPAAADGKRPAMSAADYGKLVSEMEKHGLTEAEQRQLYTEEGFADTATFAGAERLSLGQFMALRDDDFELSGIDIQARRAEQLTRDRDAAKDRYQAALARRDANTREQVQELLDKVGLSPEGREAVRSVRDLRALHQLGRDTPWRNPAMVKLKLHAADCRKLKAFCRTEQVPQTMVAPQVSTELVMTEPQRQSVRWQQERQLLRRVDRGSFPFEGEAFGTTGVLHAIGTKGGTQPWANPCTDPDLPHHDAGSKPWRREPFGAGGVTVVRSASQEEPRRRAKRRSKLNTQAAACASCKREMLYYHPDQWSGASEPEQKAAAEKFKEAKTQLNVHSAALKLLTDTSKSAFEAVDYGQAAAFTSRPPEEPGECYTEDREGSWMAVDLGVGRRLAVEHFALRNDGSGIYAPRSWVLEGADSLAPKGGKWTTLSTHDADVTLRATTFDLDELTSDGKLLHEGRPEESGAYAEGDWPVPPARPEEGGGSRAFRCFRVRQTGANAFGSHRLACGGIELYGMMS